MKKFFKYFNAVFLLAIIGVIGYIITHRQNLLDYLALRNYSPSAVVIKLGDDTAMTAKTRNVFYVNHPSIEEKKSFAGACPQQEKTIVLGCFISNKGIYLLDVTDQRLQGIVEVTAAHEVLHAMYDRLSSGEKARVDKMTSDFFVTLDNKRIKTNIENYRAKDPGVVPNELHSILATEVRDLSPELESYYSQYFKDRKAIVVFSEKYEQTFTNIEQQVKELDAQLKNLKTQIDAEEAQLKDLGSQVDSQRTRLDNLVKSKKIAEYNAGVESFNNLVNRYNALIRDRQAKSVTYNKIVDQYNNLATTEASLVKSLETNDIQPIDGN